MADHNNAKDAVTAWLNESEGFSLRIERLHEDAASGNDLVPWLVEAFRLGADRAAPEGQTLSRAVGDDHDAGWTLPTDDLAAIKDQAYEKWGEVVSLEAVEAIALEVERRILASLTPPPAAPTDNTALVADRPIDTSRKDIDTCLFRGSPGWHNRLLRAVADERDVVRAEIERLTKERDNLSKLEQSHREQANEQFHRANKAEAERDEARASLRHMEGFERCTCGPCAIHGSAMLADAERDMRQRAADTAREAWRDGYDATPHILALPLKHADREDRAALAQGQKEGE